MTNTEVIVILVVMVAGLAVIVAVTTSYLVATINRLSKRVTALETALLISIPYMNKERRK